MTLEEFYSSFLREKNKFWTDLGTAMLSALKMINDTFLETTVYGLTSHAYLNFLNKDNSEADSLVTIHAIGDEYNFEYLMPASKQPWPNARIKGATKSIVQLRTNLIIAMTESQGWPESEELRKLYQSIVKK